MKTDNNQPLQLLFIDHTPALVADYRRALTADGLTPESRLTIRMTSCTSGAAALEAVAGAVESGARYAVVFIDLGSGVNAGAVRTGEKIRALDPHVNFVLTAPIPDDALGNIARRIPPSNKRLCIHRPFHAQEIAPFVWAVGAKWRSEMMLGQTNRELADKVGKLENSRRALLENQTELERATQQLMETNDALSVLARNLERSRKQAERRTFNRAVTLMMPIVEKLQRDPKLVRYRTDLGLLTGYIQELAGDISGELQAMGRLSAAEMRIAAMIRNGMTSRQIAEHLCISPDTVKTHRRNIRRKLDLAGSSVNLRAYLLGGQR